MRGKITGGAYSSLRNGTGKWPVQRLLIKHLNTVVISDAGVSMGNFMKLFKVSAVKTLLILVWFAHIN